MQSNIDMEDAVLMGLSGPAFIYVQLTRGEEREPIGVGIRHSGRQDDYEDYERAAERLCTAGLLRRAFDGSPIHYYKFTERGKIAHWALREAFLR